MNKKQSSPAPFHFEYADTAFDSLLVELQQQTGGIYENGTFQLRPEMGSGSIRLSEIENGLYLRHYHFTPAINFHFHTKKPVGGDRFYHLYFFLDRSNHPSPVNKEGGRYKIAGNSIFMPNCLEMHGSFKAGNEVKAIDLIFTPKWLEKNKLVSDEHVQSFFSALQKDCSASLLLNNTEIFDYTAVSNIYNSMNAGEEVSLKMRINCLMLVNRFFADLAARKCVKPRKPRSSHLSEIVIIEARVREHLDTELPQLKKLAGQVHMSASTLKRHFKAVYGKNIYEYYLEKKMDLAKRMLMKDGLSISEVAYTLGYEKAGSLTTAFKKVYGLLPRDIKNY